LEEEEWVTWLEEEWVTWLEKELGDPFHQRLEIRFVHQVQEEEWESW